MSSWSGWKGRAFIGVVISQGTAWGTSRGWLWGLHFQLHLSEPANVNGIKSWASSAVMTSIEEFLSIFKASHQSLPINRKELTCSLPTALPPISSLLFQYLYSQKKIISLTIVGTSVSYEFEPRNGSHRYCPRWWRTDRSCHNYVILTYSLVSKATRHYALYFVNYKEERIKLTVLRSLKSS